MSELRCKTCSAEVMTEDQLEYTWHFPAGGDARAILLDPGKYGDGSGDLFIMMPYVVSMSDVAGPYCSVCVFQRLDMLNANHLTQENHLGRVEETSGTAPEGKEPLMSDTKTAAKLGDIVEYRDSEGHAKAALVIATRESVAEGTFLAAPEEGTVNLMVFSPSGNTYLSSDIPEGEGAHTFTVR